MEHIDQEAEQAKHTATATTTTSPSASAMEGVTSTTEKEGEKEASPKDPQLAPSGKYFSSALLPPPLRSQT